MKLRCSRKWVHTSTTLTKPVTDLTDDTGPGHSPQQAEAAQHMSPWHGAGPAMVPSPSDPSCVQSMSKQVREVTLLPSPPQLSTGKTKARHCGWASTDSEQHTKISGLQSHRELKSISLEQLECGVLGQQRQTKKNVGETEEV